MSDLISRSELLEEIKSLSIVLNGKQIFSDDAKDTVLRIINEQPTAYSVDRVVQELEKEKTICFLTDANTGNEVSDLVYRRVYSAIDKANETVKQGGLSDDVCEWRMTDTKRLMPYKTSCGNEDLYDNSYKYCPYCSKKIRLV